MTEREADLIMWQRDRMDIIWRAGYWPGYFFAPFGGDTPKQILAKRARGIYPDGRPDRASHRTIKDPS